MKPLIIISILLLSGCTDAGNSKLFSYGDSATITCYSGGKEIYKGKSTGKVMSEKDSDGYFFKDASDKKLKEVSGNCVISYDS